MIFVALVVDFFLRCVGWRGQILMCSGERFLLDGVVVGCVCQSLRERLEVWCGNSAVLVGNKYCVY